MKPHTPTKSCPHRFCRPVHLILGAIGVAGAGPLLWRAGWGYLVFSALAVVILMQVDRIAWKGKSALDRMAEEEVAEGAGGAGNMSFRNLVVRPVWANIAVALDIVLAFISAQTLWYELKDTLDYSVPTSGGIVAIVLVVLSVLVWFWNFAHRKATEPAKPLRVPAAIKVWS